MVGGVVGWWDSGVVRWVGGVVEGWGGRWYPLRVTNLGEHHARPHRASEGRKQGRDGCQDEDEGLQAGHEHLGMEVGAILNTTSHSSIQVWLGPICSEYHST